MTAPAPAERLAPDVAAVVGAIAVPEMDASMVQAIRSFELPGTDPPHGVIRTEHALTDAGAGVRVRVTRPEARGAPALGVVSMHGGGYVIGSATMDDPFFDEVTPVLGIVGISVEYRLAPETPYPGPLEDCYQALQWVVQHAEELGVDPSRIGVRGLSAGGGLAAALALLARERGEIDLAFQLLDSPMLDDRQVTASSRVDGLPVWSRESNTFGWRSYLGDRHGTHDIPSTAAPARATDDELAALPPTFVSVGAVDGFLDEDVEYARRLMHVGVPTELHVYAGACHGYQMAPDSEVAKQSRRDARDWLARRLGSPV